MKYRLMVLALVVGLTTGWYYWSKPVDAEVEPVAVEAPIPSEVPKDSLVTLEGKSYGYGVWKNIANTKINLIANFTQQETVANLIEKNGCLAAINGGFYDKQNRPLGWLVENKQVVKKPSESLLFNGFVYKSGNGAVAIKKNPPTTTVIWGVQTGPVVWENGRPVQLKLANDKYARRMVMGLTKSNLVVWLTVYGQDSVFDGPKLIDLPKVVGQVNEQEKLGLNTAINLDGGSASAFYSPEKKLYEFNAVGSLLCAK